MEQELSVNKAQAKDVYLILKEHLSRKPEGESLIHAFESDPEQYEQGLANYLQTQLSKDDVLAEQIANALDGSDGAHFTNVVTGGQVDQIINIAKLGVLNLTLEKKYFAFRDIRQLSLFLLTVILVGAFLYGVYWYLSQPTVMDGDFNIAVAQFGEVTGNDVKASTVATQLSNRLFDFLDSEFTATNFNLDVQITHKNIPIIVGGDEEAQRLAEKTNAHLVVYGNMIVADDSAEAEFSPRFYVAEHPDTTELTGQEQLALPIPFDISALNHKDKINSILRSRASILFLFTEGLTYLTADNYEAAASSLTSATNDANAHELFAGREVLYLILGMTYRLQGNYSLAEKNFEEALAINPEYARAYTGLGNIYYLRFQEEGFSDDAKFERALHEYEQALVAKDRPRGAYVDEKVNYALGNTYLVGAQLKEDVVLFEQAIKHYDRVVSQYEKTGDEKLRALASTAFFGLGAAYERQKDYLQARDAYQHSLNNIVTDPELTKRVEERLEFVEEQLK
jgi:tetratricopeptide (TPR) repeat protein